MKLKEGYTGFTSSVRLAGRLWTKPCPLCIFHNTCRIHFIFAHIIKWLQKVCRVLLQNYKIWIFGKFFEFVTLTLFFMTWDLIWITSIGNRGGGGISERRRSSCSSSVLNVPHYFCGGKIESINIQRLDQNSPQFGDVHFKCIFLIQNSNFTWVCFQVFSKPVA